MSVKNQPMPSPYELWMWTMIKSDISYDDDEQERPLFAWQTLPFGRKPAKQQGLKLKIGIHHLMASTEWVLSDDWKLWHNAQWGFYIFTLLGFKVCSI